tara:strand:+ start:9423 stop:10160 length:738 start_codon:yes stop_codon:yes gene_type:complete
MLPIAVGAILYGGLPYFLLVVLMAGLILFEWDNICEGRTPWLLFAVQVAGLLAAAYATSEAISPKGEWVAAYVAVLLLVAWRSGASLVWGLVGLLYAVLPGVGLIYLRHYEEQGGLIVLWMMIIVWSMDTGAYFAGKKIGGPKLAPRISPKKTWAGLIGGMVFAGITGTLAAYVMAFTPLLMMAVAACLMALWSQVGDLVESALKRHFNVKDSGAIIPGHGGVMDRVDGIIFVAPVVAAYYYFML